MSKIVVEEGTMFKVVEEEKEMVEYLTTIPNLKEVLNKAEKQTLIRAMRITRGNQSEAARRLGVSRSRLIYKLKQFGLA